MKNNGIPFLKMFFASFLIAIAIVSFMNAYTIRREFYTYKGKVTAIVRDMKDMINSLRQLVLDLKSMAPKAGSESQSKVLPMGMLFGNRDITDEINAASSEERSDFDRPSKF